MPEQLYDLRNKRVWVAGQSGMVGSAILRRLGREGCHLLRSSHAEVDLTSWEQTEAWMAAARPQAVFMAAAKVGGIHANDSYPADFLHQNLMIEANVVEAARRHGVEKLLFLGSSCIYPRLAPQPIPEDALLTGPLEPTNQWYAIAKIAGVMLCQAYRRQHGCDFISAMPTNLYGPGDNFDPLGSHVIPALMLKADRARREGAAFMEVWGSGRPRREFLHVDDLADAALRLMTHYSDESTINIGAGEDLSIRALAELVADVVGFEGELRFDASKPDGTPRKLLDIGRIRALGWSPTIPLAEGLAQTYEWFLQNRPETREHPRRSRAPAVALPLSAAFAQR
ncbi:GDP-L-fucose synthase [Tistlia consotensis]|uniref:GDP-L-fucose synthase n=1 Tax=Tistlia consotensis USBA 355 TaxID=560819 RepID=A0A1Y6CFL9_9PROT|nr:GDP-L-fucose synthase [Tistlia consotensis]SMF58779.1 GDP-L-fucose synthase [Tistlia consotensis USBA 355]SNR63960.1 GDP-L-fucose synthase [Tistlia consotensis]